MGLHVFPEVEMSHFNALIAFCIHVPRHQLISHSLHIVAWKCLESYSARPSLPRLSIQQCTLRVPPRVSLAPPLTPIPSCRGCTVYLPTGPPSWQRVSRACAGLCGAEAFSSFGSTAGSVLAGAFQESPLDPEETTPGFKVAGPLCTPTSHS